MFLVNLVGSGSAQAVDSERKDGLFTESRYTRETDDTEVMFDAYHMYECLCLYCREPASASETWLVVLRHVELRLPS